MWGRQGKSEGAVGSGGLVHGFFRMDLGIVTVEGMLMYWSDMREIRSGGAAVGTRWLRGFR
jgi:hypothetical protein